MEPKRLIEELTRRNVAIVAEMEKAAAQVRTRGERLAEWLAAWVGSWSFLAMQSAVLAGVDSLEYHRRDSLTGTRIRSFS